MLKDHVTNIIVLIVVSLVQLFLGSRITLFGTFPDMLTICIVFIALRYGMNTSMTYGFFTGLLIGFFTGPFGLDALAKTIEGFVAGFFHIPEDSHASPSQKRKMFFTSLMLASLSGKTVVALAVNLQALPLWLHLLLNVLLASTLTLLLGAAIYQFVLRKTILLN
ncbi:histidine kinase [Prosthecochloris sp. N3]|uniref:Histidine kinase n=1 Tax=Prosthecochloris ethylica TaxID=2743976 RepID=A0ABR9XRG5_9CHLB|nr:MULTISPECIES: histidine kinase [Prosthecochloris]MEC9487456.1 histidine kinase [Prosthecochloris sp.]MBF0586736.1 histidine kinase [Prosthecochloris ethylica]MBF0636642.1 histidine kinase [Prosthecochloris ethylica]NUK47959.1 histidine kinase [Prosthecochloris ethylica]RNA65260.1 histidine kinase [Prosthecochloris sp. ZM_2]